MGRWWWKLKMSVRMSRSNQSSTSFFCGHCQWGSDCRITKLQVLPVEVDRSYMRMRMLQICWHPIFPFEMSKKLANVWKSLLKVKCCPSGSRIKRLVHYSWCTWLLKMIFVWSSFYDILNQISHAYYSVDSLFRFYIYGNWGGRGV